MTFADFYSSLRLGDVVVARNVDRNTTPGWWNHGSIYVGDGIVEARSSKDGVVKSSVREFFDRYPLILALRFKTITVAQQALLAEAGNKLVGKPYWFLSSILAWLWPLVGRRKKAAIAGENCVSTPRRAYSKVLGIDFAWHWPDHIVEDTRFEKVAEKK